MPASQRLRRLWPNALLFALLAAVLLYVQWITYGHRILQELGDFGANSLLVLDAKRLHLLYGNYSRIGVNHPGPAILYVLAAGEWMFHDVLRIAPSPFSGQLLVICLYSAAWLTLIFASMRRMAGDVTAALMYTTVFAGVVGYFDPQVFLGAWFPDLYILPFAAMLVAISRLVYGETDTLRALAVSSGFLANGHVSFIPMLGTILVVVLSANWLIAWRDTDRRILSAAFLVRHGRAFLAAVGILALFFVPLLIASIVEYPGPVHDYIRFGGVEKHNATKDALKFVGEFWIPGHAWIWGVLLALLLVTGLRAPSQDMLGNDRSIGIALGAASLALLVYAKFGIDHLELTYLGLFYYAVPAHAVALVALYAVRTIRPGSRTAVAGAAALVGAAGIFVALHKLPFYADRYHVDGTAALYERMRSLPGGGRIVLDVDAGDPGWDTAWSNVVALLLYARRQEHDLFCINDGWHILFTRPAHCRPDELETSRRFLVRAERSRGLAQQNPDIFGQGLLLYRHSSPADKPTMPAPPNGPRS